MNLIKNFWHPSEDLSTSRKEPFINFVGEGTFYQLRKSTRETIFPTAKIRFNLGEDDFQATIAIENAQLKTRKRIDKENINNEYNFKITEKLNLTTDYARKKAEDIMTFEWQYDGNNTYGFEFKNKKRNLVIASNFKELICKLIYQNKNETFVTDKTPVTSYLCYCKTKEDLEASYQEPIKLITSSDISCSTPNDMTAVPEQNLSALKTDKMEIESDKSNSKVSDKVGNSGLAVRNPKFSEHSLSAPIHSSAQSSSLHLGLSEKGYIFQKQGDLFQLDETYQFIKMEESVVLCLKHVEKKSYHLEIHNAGGLQYFQIIEEDTVYLDFEGQLFKWVDLQDETLRVLGFKIHQDPQGGLEELREALKNPSALDTIQIDNPSSQKALSSISNSAVRANLLVRYEEEFSGQVEPMREILEEEYEEGFEGEEGDIIDYEEVGEEELEYKKLYKYYDPINTNNYQDRYISQSKLLNRVFISRGPVVSVFKANDSLDFICNLPDLTTLQNELIHPKKILFYHNDTKMLILNQNLEKKIYSLDLEKGLITNEWAIDGYNNILDFDHLVKNGELAHNDIFMGINNKNIFQFDPNHPEIPMSIKNYSTNPKFSCFSTTSQGYAAIGSDTGDLRLYKETGKNAKNLIYGLGEPIIGVDSTKDGSLIAATTECAVLVYHTIIDGVNGYLGSIKKYNSQPIKLEIPSNIIEKYQIENISFTKAKFDNVYSRNEQYITSTTGKLLVVWRLVDVLLGLNDPKVTEFKSEILDCEFRNDREDGILVILENEVNYLLL